MIILKVAEGCRVAVLHGAKRIANTVRLGVKGHAKNKTRFALAVKAVVWAHVSTYAKLHVRKTAKHRAKKVAKLHVKKVAKVHARNRHNAEAVKMDA